MTTHDSIRVDFPDVQGLDAGFACLRPQIRVLHSGGSVVYSANFLREFWGGIWRDVRGYSEGIWRSLRRCFRVVWKEKPTTTYNPTNFRKLLFPYQKLLSTPPEKKTLTWLNIQGCFREVWGDVWRYFWTIFGDNVGTYLRGFGGDFESLSVFRC